MATKAATLKIDLQHVDDVGESAGARLVESLVLSGYKVYRVERLALAAAASDQTLSFTNAVGLVLISHDNPFKLRLASAETLLANLRLFLVWCDDVADQAIGTSVKLTGNGSNVADLEVWVVEKTA